MDIEKQIERFSSVIDEAVKAIQSLMIANGAALVATLSLLKDYDATPKYKGIGTFINLFGLGFLTAIVAFLFAFSLRLDMPGMLPPRPAKAKGRKWSMRLTGLFAFASSLMLMTAVFLIITRFKGL